MALGSFMRSFHAEMITSVGGAGLQRTEISFVVSLGTLRLPVANLIRAYTLDIQIKGRWGTCKVTL